MGLPAPRMTVSEFLVWEAQQAERYEFFRGETFAMVGGTARHNRVILNLASRIGEHLDGSGCQVFAENMKLQLAEAVLYPDLMVTCAKAEAGDEHSFSDATLVIEVLSPSTRGYDKREKFILYRALASLQEYVLIDPVQRQIEVFTLAEAGAWLLTDQTQASALRLKSIGFELPVAAVFKGVANDGV